MLVILIIVNFVLKLFYYEGLLFNCWFISNYWYFFTNSRLPCLTPDKSYPVTGIDNIGYRIIDDELRDFWYTKELFYPIEEERDRKLNEIGI